MDEAEDGSLSEERVEAVERFLGLIRERVLRYRDVNMLVLIEHDAGSECVSTQGNLPWQRGMLEMRIDALRGMTTVTRSEVVVVDDGKRFSDEEEEEEKGRVN